MGSPSYRLAAAITIPSTGEFLVVRQPRPPSPPAEEGEDYRRFVDSDLYDLPSAPLEPVAGEPRSEVAIAGADSVAGLDLSRFDVSAALDQVSYPFSLSSYCLFFPPSLFDSTGNFWRLAVIASISTNVTVASRQIFYRFGLPDGMRGEWRLLKYVEEAEFGPDAGVKTVFLIGSLLSKLDALPGEMLKVLVFLTSINCLTVVCCACTWQSHVNG